MTADLESTDAIVTEVLTDLAGPGRADPYPLYERLRALGPVVPDPTGSLLITGYRLATALVRDHRLIKRPELALHRAGFENWRERPGLRLMFESMLVRNPPVHTRLRRQVASEFTARRVAGLREAIERIVTGLLDDLGSGGTRDFVAAFAFPLPVTVIGELLGIPEPDRPRFQLLVRDWTGVLDQLDEPTVTRADPAAVEIHAYFTELLALRRRSPRDDLISALGQADGLGDEEIVTTVALLLAAGFETTTGLLTNGLVALLRHPDQAELLRTRPELAGPAVEELLRYDSPVQLLTSRTAPEELEVEGLRLPAGQRVVTLIGAANRDPAVFPEPDRLRLDRDGEAPLSFGGGLHYCLGAPLARLEARIAFPALLRAFPGLALAGAPVHRDGLALHGLIDLPVAV